MAARLLHQQGDPLSNINPIQLKQFMRICTLGSMETNASMLESEQQQHLFELLDKVHAEKDIDCKGIWGLLSLCFKNRSGLVLMSMYKNSNVSTEHFLVRKGFLKDIEILENNKVTTKNIHRILNAIDLHISLFLDKFNAFKDNLRTAEFIHNAGPIVALSEVKILEENDYDSEPDTKFYIDLREIQDEDTIFRRYSMFEPSSILQNQNADSFWEEEETVSLKKRPLQPFQRPARRTKKAKRPNPHKKKKRMMEEIKNKETSMIKFMNRKYERKKLRGTFNVIRNMREEDQNITPRKSPSNLVRKQKTGRKNNRMNKSKRKQSSSMDIEYNNQEQKSDYSDDESYVSQTEFDGRNRKRLHQRVQQIEEQSNFQNLRAAQDEQVNETIENLWVKTIQFPQNVDDLKQMGLFTEEDDKYFNSEEMDCCLNSLNEKQKFSKVKQIVSQKSVTSIESVMISLQIYKNTAMRQFTRPYTKPILVHKLGKLISGVINQIINILFTSFSNGEFIALYEQCKQVILLNHQIISMNSSFLKQFGCLVLDSLLKIVIDINKSVQRVDSMIELPKPFDILKETMKIKLSECDLIESVLIAIQIVIHSFLKDIYGISADDKSIPAMQDLKDQIYSCYKQKIRDKPKFMKMICQIYTKFNIPITRKEELEQVLSFAKQIDLQSLNKSQTQEFVQILPELTRSFILQKMSKDKNFNFKHALNYILTNQFMKDRKKNQSELDQKIVLQTYQVLLEFDKFHTEMTVKEIVGFIKNIEYQQKYGSQFWLVVLKLLTKCYEIKIVQQKQSNRQFIANFHQNRQRNCQQIIQVEETLLKLGKTFLQQYNDASKHIKQKAQNKISKYECILQSFITQFIENEKISHQIHHFFLSMKFLFTVFLPIIAAQKKENLFIRIISQCFVNKVQSIEEIFNDLQKEITTVSISNDNFTEIDEMQILFELKQEAKKESKKLMHFLTSFFNSFSPQVQSHQFLGFAEMQSDKQNVILNIFQFFYEIKGILTGFCLLNNKSIIKVKEINDLLKHHTKQVRIIKVDSLFRSTNKLVCQFLKGFLKILKIFHIDVEVERRLKDLGVGFRESMFDILMIGLTCQKQVRSIVELVMIANKTPFIKNCEHFLTKVEVDQKLKDMSTLYESVQQNQRIKQMPLSIILKFKTVYLQTWINLFQKYIELKWNQLRSHLALNITSTFTYLLSIDAPQDILKSFRQYFIMTNSEISSSLGLQNNILRGLEIKQSCYYSACAVVRLFKVVYEKRRQFLDRTKEFYFEYVVNLSLCLDKEKDVESYNLSRIKIIIQAIEQMCTIRESYNEELKNNQMSCDSFSMSSCEYLLSDLIKKSYLKDSVKDKVIAFFFSLFRKFPKLAEVFMSILKVEFNNIDKIIGKHSNSEQLGCGSLEDALKKYVVNKGVYFDKLYHILWLRSRNSSVLRKDGKDGVKQLKQIVDICLRILQEKGSYGSPVFNSFNQLKENMREEERNFRPKLDIEHFFTDHHTSKQVSNSHTQSLIRQK